MRLRLRSSTRDENADARRLSSIERSLSIAITEAKSEKEGLQRRLDAARLQASIWLGNQTSEYLDREPETERLVVEAEQNLISREKRIHQLKAHLDHLARVLEFLQQK
jgi:hypothetical protein